MNDHLRSNSNDIKLFIEADPALQMEKSWRCCKCNNQNYNDKWACSACSHERCSKCKDLLG